MENLIEELTKVNPANLSEEGLKLFNKIMEIIDRNEELESKIKEKIENKKKALKNNELEFDEICEIEHSIREFQELLQEGDK